MTGGGVLVFCFVVLDKEKKRGRQVGEEAKRAVIERRRRRATSSMMASSLKNDDLESCPHLGAREADATHRSVSGRHAGLFSEQNRAGPSRGEKGGREARARKENAGTAF